MRQFTILPFFILMLATYTVAQNAVNVNNRQRFNGGWIFDAKKSDAHPSFKELYKGQTLEISYDEPELKIVKTQTLMNRTRARVETKSAILIFYADNRGEKNKPYPFNEKLEVESNTVWEKDILIRTYTTKLYKSGKVVGADTSKQTYAISEDGDTFNNYRRIAGKNYYGFAIWETEDG